MQAAISSPESPSLAAPSPRRAQTTPSCLPLAEHAPAAASAAAAAAATAAWYHQRVVPPPLKIPKSLQSFPYLLWYWLGYIYPASQCENMRLYRRLLAPRCTTITMRYIVVHHTGTPCSVCRSYYGTYRYGESHSGTVLYIPVVLHHPRQSEAIRDHISDCLSSETVLKISTTRGVNSILPEVRRWCSGRGRIIMCR